MTHDDNSQEIKKSFFGQVKKIEATGGHTPDLGRLQKPLEGPDSVVRLFCTGCGTYVELTQRGAEIMVRPTNVSLPASLEGNYLKTASCSACDGDDPTVTIEII